MDSNAQTGKIVVKTCQPSARSLRDGLQRPSRLRLPRQQRRPGAQFKGLIPGVDQPLTDMESLPSRDVAESRSTDLPARLDPWKSAVWTFERGDMRFFVKDLRHTSPLYRYTVGRLMMGHEARIYRRLRDVDFVPSFHGRLDRDSLVLGLISGTSLRDCEAANLPEDFFEMLQARVDQLHARGVVHMDLRHRTNIFVRSDGKPMLLDFESALYVGGWLARLLGWVDRSAVLKFRMRYASHQVSDRQTKRDRRFRFFRRLWPFGRWWPPRRLPGFGRRHLPPAGSKGPSARDEDRRTLTDRETRLPSGTSKG